MDERQTEQLRYTILDPTGNITALVESPVDPARQPAAAAALMARHPAVEQVGFLRLETSPGSPVRGALRMAGGEFCGNASLCAAALVLLDRGPHSGGDRETVRLRVSGAAEPVTVRLNRTGPDSFRGGVRMPPALGVTEEVFSAGGANGRLPVVRMEGISHIVVGPASPFFDLLGDRPAAEAAVRAWCAALSADGLGLMFLEGEGPARRLTPLVYIPGSGTVFWENSCASGTAAAGRYLAEQAGGPAALTLAEPGGSLRVESDPVSGETWLYGGVRVLKRVGP